MFLKESFCVNAAVAITFNVNLPKTASCFFLEKGWLEEGRGKMGRNPFGVQQSVQVG